MVPETLDVKSAFLNDTLDEGINVEKPKGFEATRFDKFVYRL